MQNIKERPAQSNRMKECAASDLEVQLTVF